MNRERLLVFTAFYRSQRRDRRLAGRIRGDAVNRLSREYYQTSAPQGFHGVR
jgi:hypothetical protein